MTKFKIGDKVRIEFNYSTNQWETGTIISDPFPTQGDSGPVQEGGPFPELTAHITYKVRKDSTQEVIVRREGWLEFAE